MTEDQELFPARPVVLMDLVMLAVRRRVAAALQALRDRGRARRRSCSSIRRRASSGP